VEFLRQHVGVAIAGALAIFCAIVWIAVYAATPTHALTFAVLDVGQGDSLYIEGPTGVQVVIDGGPGSAVLRALPDVMPQFDRSLDAVIETHPDADHISGFVDLLKRYEVGAFIEPGIEKDTATAKNLEQEITELHIPRVIARRGMWLDLGGGARLKILFPDYDVSHINQNKDNEGGIVAHLVYGDTSVLLMADVDFDVENHLMAISDPSDLASTILKVGHHGSKTSSGSAFVSEVDPQIAVISVGAKNTYGHPTARVLNLLASQHIETLRTDKSGTVVCRSNGAEFSCSGSKN
jgi:competence protein ComEC